MEMREAGSLSVTDRVLLLTSEFGAERYRHASLKRPEFPRLVWGQVMKGLSVPAEYDHKPAQQGRGIGVFDLPPPSFVDSLARRDSLRPGV